MPAFSHKLRGGGGDYRENVFLLLETDVLDHKDQSGLGDEFWGAWTNIKNFSVESRLHHRLAMCGVDPHQVEVKIERVLEDGEVPNEDYFRSAFGSQEKKIVYKLGLKPREDINGVLYKEAEGELNVISLTVFDEAFNLYVGGYREFAANDEAMDIGVLGSSINELASNEFIKWANYSHYPTDGFLPNVFAINESSITLGTTGNFVEEDKVDDLPLAAHYAKVLFPKITALLPHDVNDDIFQHEYVGYNTEYVSGYLNKYHQLTDGWNRTNFVNVEEDDIIGHYDPLSPCAFSYSSTPNSGFGNYTLPSINHNANFPRVVIDKGNVKKIYSTKESPRYADLEKKIESVKFLEGDKGSNDSIPENLQENVRLGKVFRSCFKAFYLGQLIDFTQTDYSDTNYSLYPYPTVYNSLIDPVIVREESNLEKAPCAMYPSHHKLPDVWNEYGETKYLNFNGDETPVNADIALSIYNGDLLYDAYSKQGYKDKTLLKKSCPYGGEMPSAWVELISLANPQAIAELLRYDPKGEELGAKVPKSATRKIQSAFESDLGWDTNLSNKTKHIDRLYQNAKGWNAYYFKRIGYKIKKAFTEEELGSPLENITSDRSGKFNYYLANRSLRDLLTLSVMKSEKPLSPTGVDLNEGNVTDHRFNTIPHGLNDDQYDGIVYGYSPYTDGGNPYFNYLIEKGDLLQVSGEKNLFSKYFRRMTDSTQDYYFYNSSSSKNRFQITPLRKYHQENSEKYDPAKLWRNCGVSIWSVTNSAMNSKEYAINFVALRTGVSARYLKADYIPASSDQSYYKISMKKAHPFIKNEPVYLHIGDLHTEDEDYSISLYRSGIGWDSQEEMKNLSIIKMYWQGDDEDTSY